MFHNMRNKAFKSSQMNSKRYIKKTTKILCLIYTVLYCKKKKKKNWWDSLRKLCLKQAHALKMKTLKINPAWLLSLQFYGGWGIRSPLSINVILHSHLMAFSSPAYTVYRLSESGHTESEPSVASCSWLTDVEPDVLLNPVLTFRCVLLSEMLFF